MQEILDKYHKTNKERVKLIKDIKILEAHLSVNDEDDEVDERDSVQLRKEIVQKQAQLKTLNQSLRKFERDLLRFSHYGEVKAILPKTAESSGKQLKDYEFVRAIGGRFGT